MNYSTNSPPKFALPSLSSSDLFHFNDYYLGQYSADSSTCQSTSHAFPEEQYASISQSHATGGEQQVSTSGKSACRKRSHAEIGRADSTSSCSQDDRQPMKKRNCSEKEKRRNSAINIAFDTLQGMMPYTPSDQKLPKIKTLRLALQYIKLLDSILGGGDGSHAEQRAMVRPFMGGTPRPLGVEDFAPIVAAEMQTKNSYRERACQILGKQSSSSPPPSGNSSKSENDQVTQ